MTFNANGEIVRAVSQSAPVLILVHYDIEPPVQAVFDAPMRANDLVEAFGGQGQGRAEQAIGDLARKASHQLQNWARNLECSSCRMTGVMFPSASLRCFRKFASQPPLTPWLVHGLRSSELQIL